MKEEIVQLKVPVPIKLLWKAMTSNLKHVVPKVLPDIVEEVELLEVNGGHGTIFLFKFFPHVPRLRPQKNKVMTYDESLYELSFEILEGAHLDRGLARYTNVFKFHEVGEAETLIDFKVLFETKPEHPYTLGDATNESLNYLKLLGDYLSKCPF